MRTQSGQFMFARLAIAICVLLLFSPILSSAQGADPIVGTWNFNGAASDGSDPFIAVISFNLGGTTVEYDTSGTNSYAPGESIALGSWEKKSALSYTFKQQNYTYNSAGVLHSVAILRCQLSFTSTLNKLGGPCELNFHECSVSKCPGNTVIYGPIALILNGRRF